MSSDDIWDKILIAAGLAVAGAVALTTATAAVSLAESFVDNVVRDKIDEPAIGSVVYCDLALFVEHSGIYVGNGEIVHLDGSGRIVRTGGTTFLNRLEGVNPAMSIYAACSNTTPKGNHSVADYALELADEYVDYSLLMNNCHMFSASCLQIEKPRAFYNTLKALKILAWKEHDINSWRVWDRG